jgi:DNA polymerase
VSRGATEHEAATAAKLAAAIEREFLPQYRYEAILKTDQYGNIVKTGLLGYAENMQVKLSPEQAYLAWETFRKSYPEVVLYWYDLERAALDVLEFGGKMRVGVVEFSRVKNMLRITLPSGRGLHYLNARIEIREITGRDGKVRKKPGVLYDGIGHGVGKMGEGWGPVYIYGGKFAENIVQAISRDLLLYGMLLADEMGACIVHHAHDEIVAESEKEPFAFTLHDLRWCMTQIPAWAPGLPLGADGYTSQVYKKG